MKIDLTFIDLRNQKIVKQYDGYLLLLPDRIHYKHEFKAEEPKDTEDEYSVWEKVMNCYEVGCVKSKISSVGIEFLQATEGNKNGVNRWKIIVAITGMNNDIVLYLSEENEARRIYEIIFKWLFNE